MGLSIEELVDRIPKLPTLPGVALKILEAVKKDELSLQELGEIISNDPALSSEVLRLINSSFFSLPREVLSVTHAVNLLGSNTIKNIALSFSLVKNFEKLPSSYFDYEQFWKNSVINGISTRLLAKTFLPGFAEDAFFLGLLHNIGILALSQCLPDQYEMVVRETRTSDCNWHEAENKILGFDHTQFGEYLVKSWGLPDNFSVPIRYHHNPEQMDVEELEITRITQILSLASLFTDFFSNSGSTKPLILFESYAEIFGLAGQLDVNETMQLIKEQADEISPLFNVEIRNEEKYFQMIEEARKELIHISSDFINDLLKQKKQIEELNHRAIQDSMTGLMNFHFFNETLEKEINRSMQYRLPLSLIMSDVDHFKRINDTWGHLAGDHILQSIAQCLQKSISEPNTLSRYGGEEFAIILPETDLTQATKIAEALRAEVQELQSEFEGVRIPVTMSFGIADLFFKQDNTKNTLIKKADHALYTAKKSGRNRCHAYSGSSEHPGL